MEKYSAQKQCIFMSGLDYETVSLLKEQRPDWWVGYCIYGSAGDFDEAVWKYNIDFLAVEEGVVSSRFMERARKQPDSRVHLTHRIILMIWQSIFRWVHLVLPQICRIWQEQRLMNIWTRINNTICTREKGILYGKGEALTMRTKRGFQLYTGMWLLAVLLLIMMLLWNAGDARIINYSGLVRGATQRLVKEEMTGRPDDELNTRLDGIIYDLRLEEGSYGLAKKQ